MDNFRATVLEMAKTKTQLVLQPGVFNQNFPGLTIYAQQVDRKDSELRKVFVQDTSQDTAVIGITAPKGHLFTDQEKGQIVFSLEDGRLYRHDQQECSVIGFGRYRLALDLKDIITGVDLEERRPKEMSWPRLLDLHSQDDLAHRRDPTFDRKVDVEIHKRLALPLACLALGLFALPLAALFEGLRRHFGFLLSLGLFLVYYTLFSTGLSLGETGVLSPFVGLWTPNLVFIGLAVGLFHFVVREHGSMALQRYLRRLKKEEEDPA
jgi:lipopolysaccharide export system permease protein